MGRQFGRLFKFAVVAVEDRNAAQSDRATGALWLLSTMLLIAAGLGVLSEQTWWRSMAIGGAAVSCLAIGLWWKADPPGAKFGAVFNVVEIAALLSPLGAPLLF